MRSIYPKGHLNGHILLVSLDLIPKPGIEVFSRDGKRWGALTVGGSNCAFGGEDMRTLFITTGKGLASTKLLIPGLP